MSQPLLRWFGEEKGESRDKARLGKGDSPHRGDFPPTHTHTTSLAGPGRGGWCTPLRAAAAMTGRGSAVERRDTKWLPLPTLGGELP